MRIGAAWQTKHEENGTLYGILQYCGDAFEIFIGSGGCQWGNWEFCDERGEWGECGIVACDFVCGLWLWLREPLNIHYIDTHMSTASSQDTIPSICGHRKQGSIGHPSRLHGFEAIVWLLSNDESLFCSLICNVGTPYLFFHTHRRTYISVNDWNDALMHLIQIMHRFYQNFIISN